MTGNADRELFTVLCGQIERAWFDDHNRLLVYELVQKYPQFQDELYEFFEDLVLGPGIPTPAVEEAEERVNQWLQSSSLEIARTAAAEDWSRRITAGAKSSTVTDTVSNANEIAVTDNKPRTKNESESFQVFLRKRLKQRLVDLAESLPNVTTEYLVLISRHPGLLPEKVKQTLARYVEERWQVPIRESLTYLTGNPTALRAASRLQPYEKEPSNFQELLERAGMSTEQKSFWLKLTK